MKLKWEFYSDEGMREVFLLSEKDERDLILNKQRLINIELMQTDYWLIQTRDINWEKI